MQHKTYAPTIKAADDDGTASWIMATLNEVDHDGDVALPGAFGRQTFSIMPAHEHRHVPLGKALLREDGKHAIVEARFNLDIQAARDWHSAIKFDFENPPSVQEYSYGYNLHEGGWETGTHKGQRVRLFHARPNGSPGVDVYESSPVLRGAGTGTRTLAVKSDQEAQLRRELLRIKAGLGPTDAELRDQMVAIRARLETCAIKETFVEATSFHWSECAPPSRERQEVAWAALSAACADLNVDLPLLRWFGPESPAEAEHAKRYARDWPCFQTDVAVRGAWQPPTRTVWVAPFLPVKTLVATIAHEVAHAAGGDEEAAQKYERRWAGNRSQN